MPTTEELLLAKGWQPSNEEYHQDGAFGIKELAIYEKDREEYMKTDSILDNGHLVMTYDYETFRDFTSTVMLSWSATWSENGKPVKKRMGHTIVKDKDGKIIGYKMIDKHIWREKHQAKHKSPKPCECCGIHYRMNVAKTVGTPKMDKRVGAKIKFACGWMMASEVQDNWPILLELLYSLAYANRISKKNKNMTIYAHNMSVDFIALNNDLQLSGANHPYTMLSVLQPPSKDSMAKFIPRGSGLLSVIHDFGDMMPDDYQRTFIGKDFKKEQDSSFPVEFRDSFALMPTALANIASICGFPKSTTPEMFTNANHPDFGDITKLEKDHVIYALNDSVALMFCLSLFMKTLRMFGYNRQDLPYTISSAGYQIMAHQYATKYDSKTMAKLFAKKKPSSKAYLSNVNDIYLDDILRECLVGGMTRVFNADIHGEGNWLAIDARASYPSTFCAQNFPYQIGGVDKSFPIHLPNFTDLKISDLSIEKLLASEHEGGAYVFWTSPVDDIGCVATVVEEGHKKGCLDWNRPNGTRWLTLLQCRWLIARGYTLELRTSNHVINDSPIIQYDENGVGIKIADTTSADISAIVCSRITQAERDVLTTPIKMAYAKRAELRLEGNPLEGMVKILLNGGLSFGKFVEQRDGVVITTQLAYDEYFDENEYAFTFAVRIGMSDYGYATSLKKVRANNTANIFGCQITDGSRINLIGMSDFIGKESIAYGDTDSLRFNLDLAPTGTEEKVQEFYGSELTQWDDEYNASYFYALSPKSYKAIIEPEVGDDGEIAKEEQVIFKMKGVNTRGMVRMAWANLTHQQRVLWGYTGLESETGNATQYFTTAYLKKTLLTDPLSYERPTALKESFRDVDKTAGTWVEITKTAKAGE